MNWTAIAAVTLALAVVFGAFGAHALRDRVDDYSLGVYETGVQYHFFHALGLLAIPLLVRAGLISAAPAGWACWLLLAGIVLFSGSLYLLAITGTTTLGAITPIGGVAFIGGWLALAYAALQSPPG